MLIKLRHDCPVVYQTRTMQNTLSGSQIEGAQKDQTK